MDLLENSAKEYTNETIKNLDYESIELAGLEFENCTFVRCKFRDCTLRECRFVECSFQECVFNMVHLYDSTFREAKFVKSQVIAVDWAEAAWQQIATLNTLSFSEECVLNYSSFFGLRLHNLRLAECIARYVDFSEADLKKADFHHTDLAESKFLHTNLTDADFTAAFSYSIDATANTLKRTRFSLPEAVSLLLGLDIVLVDENGSEIS
jgi:uncharacterized protein YjbI with pentapeptide repeats